MSKIEQFNTRRQRPTKYCLAKDRNDAQQYTSTHDYAVPTREYQTDQTPPNCPCCRWPCFRKKPKPSHGRAEANLVNSTGTFQARIVAALSKSGGDAGFIGALVAVQSPFPEVRLRTASLSSNMALVK